MSEKVLMKGNEAFAEAAIRCGCRYYFGYPITPQNELTEYMSRELPKVGGYFVQAESEIAAINMAYGGAAAGGKVFISSSSPGIALMQEAFSFLCSTELPLVILNVSRGGPGIGSIQPGQADYFQATRGGGNGDYRIPVYAPASIQEAVEMMSKAYKIADQYRNPVMILADGVLGQMMEPVLLPEWEEPQTLEDIKREKPWALVGKEGRKEHNVIKSLYLKAEDLEERVEELSIKYEKAKNSLVEYEGINLEEGEIIFVAYGSTSRVVEEAIDILGENGIKAGLIRPITLWPYPYEAFDKLTDKTKLVVSVELSMGQMIDDVKIGVKGRFPTALVNRVGGSLLSSTEIVNKTMKLWEEKR